MTAIELYQSILKTAKTKTFVYTEKWSKHKENDTTAEITETTFKITNKQGFFMQKLINENPKSSCDNLVIDQSKNHEVRLIYPPHYIKFNGLFTIKITNINL